MRPAKTPPPSLSEAVFARDCPLQGVTLVESSAGTGKTYSIQSLYLRLLLERGFTVEQLLVVTFTDAATKELGERLRDILHKALLAADGRLPADDGDAPRIERAFALQPDRDLARQRLGAALADFDQAAVCTIHGFCNRVLSEWAFECGELFEHEVVADADELLLELVYDHFRRRFGAGSLFEAALADAAGLDLKLLLEVASAAVGRHDARIVPTVDRAPTRDELQGMASLALATWREPSRGASRALRDALSSGFFLKPYADALPEHLAALDSSDPDLRPAEVIGALCACTSEALIANLKKAAAKTFTLVPGLAAFTEQSMDFDLGARLWRVAELHHLVDDVRSRFEHAKDSARLVTYDDMLVRVRAALRRPGSADQLRAKLRARHRVAVVDEFQDTDAVQWDIFRELYADGEVPVFLVGDPKQAIYAFRSGDVYTYFDAASRADRTFTLGKNFRSASALVEAVNGLFAPRHDRPPFVVSEISFLPQEARGVEPDRALTVDGRPDPCPLRLRFLRSAGKPAPKPEAQGAIARDVAAEVVRLLADPQTRLGGRPVRPADLCVLVTKHAQAELVRHELDRCGVPAVLQRSGNVFYEQRKGPTGQPANVPRPETQALLCLLRALAEPRDDRALRTALATDLFPHDARRIHDMFVDATDVEGRDEAFEVFADAGKRASAGHLGGAFEVLDRAFGLREHVLSRPQGERTLTNVLQQVELLGDRMRQRRAGLNALLAWLEALPARPDDDAAGAQEMRLETDAGAVQVMTVFKAKGLEFPITFVPFMWDSQTSVGKRPVLPYHQVDGGRSHLVLDLDAKDRPVDPSGPSRDDRVARASDEDLAEKVRLLYVAVTRAAHRTYLYWGDINETAGTSLAYLLHYRGAGDGPHFPRLKEQKAHPEADLTFLPVEPVVAAAPPERRARAAPARGPESLSWRAWPEGRDLPRGFRVASFSALASHEPEVFEGGLDFDQATHAAEPPDPSLAPILEFPAGATTGKAWHEVFEALAFDADRPTVDRAVVATLDAYRLLPAAGAARAAKCAAVGDMVQRVLRTPLGAEPDAPTLCRVPPADRVAELAFDFTLAPRATLGELCRQVEAAWPAWASLGRTFRERRDALGEGFMTGFIDLAFRDADGRYAIVDWKSNRLGAEAFDDAGLEREVARRGYALQYLIYTVALDGHLRRCLPGYDYERHFRGVYYVFLRGVDGRPGRAVHFARPPAAALEAAARLLRGGPRA